jgi:hypothetical protein
LTDGGNNAKKICIILPRKTLQEYKYNHEYILAAQRALAELFASPVGTSGTTNSVAARHGSLSPWAGQADQAHICNKMTVEIT